MLDGLGVTCLVADPVRITFLGGLGEIGRNCCLHRVRGRASCSSTAG